MCRKSLPKTLSRKFWLTLTSIFFALQAQLAFAGAWLQKADNLQLLTSYNYLSVDKFFDQNGKRYSAASFGKGEIAPYAEWGASDKVTLGGAFNLQSVLSGAGSGNVVDINSYRAAYAEVFARAYLINKPEYVLSIEPRLKLPIETDAGINPEGSQPIPELKLAYGRNLQLVGLPAYADVSANYRLRSSNNLHDMTKFEASFGASVSDDWHGLAQAFYETPLGEVDASSGNYELLKLQLSSIYDLNERAAVQAGVFSNIAGKNTAAGEGVFVSSWLKF